MEEFNLKKLIFSGKTLVMAHRGDQSVAPENTMLSFKNAARNEIDFIESDVRMTKDRKLILFHDDCLERTTSKTGRISDFTLEELMQIDLAENFSPDNNGTFPYRGKNFTVVTVEDVLKAFPGKYFNLDIKDCDPFVPEELGRIIQKCGMEKNVIIASFEKDQLLLFRRLYPDILTSAVRSEVKLFLIGVKTGLLPLFMLFKKIRYSAFQVPEISDSTRVVTPGFVKAAHKYKIAVHVWTVNEVTDMKRLLSMGVDGIFTDYPDRLINLLKEN
ncbi:MAG: glycerophosphodiester phosphodiesterase [Spirochaetes bacterium]|nr:glycerophosphodiester phosphodiesterase [Spirochaetota bacterium]